MQSVVLRRMDNSTGVGDAVEGWRVKPRAEFLPELESGFEETMCGGAHSQSQQQSNGGAGAAGAAQAPGRAQDHLLRHRGAGHPLWRDSSDQGASPDAIGLPPKTLRRGGAPSTCSTLSPHCCRRRPCAGSPTCLRAHSGENQPQNLNPSLSLEAPALLLSVSWRQTAVSSRSHALSL